MYAYFLVAIGGAVGSALRFWLTNLVSHASNSVFPWGTILVNVTGSLAIGLLAALAGAAGKMNPDSRALTTHLLIVGLCGGYTTFSSFSLQTFTLLQSRQWLAACGNVILSTALCLLATALGFWIGSMFNRPAAS